MVRALVGDSTITRVRPPPLSARTGVDALARRATGARFGSATAATAAALAGFAALVALVFVAFFAGAFFLPGRVRVAIDLRAWGRGGGE